MRTQRIIKYFNGITTAQELKAAYKKLAKQYHPDLNPDGEKTMMQINDEYDYCVDHLSELWNQTAKQAGRQPDKATTSQAMREYREIIARMITLDGINIELCGAWLWISGNTKPHKETLKAIGCCWASKKLQWYWRPEELKAVTSRKPLAMDQIRAKYGSIQIEMQTAEKVTA